MGLLYGRETERHSGLRGIIMTVQSSVPQSPTHPISVQTGLDAAMDRLQAIEWGLTLLSRTMVRPLDTDAMEQLKGAVGLGRFLIEEKQKVTDEIERLRAHRYVHEVNQVLPPENASRHALDDALMKVRGELTQLRAAS